jgi:predicted small lipoprotein YifL
VRIARALTAAAAAVALVASLSGCSSTVPLEPAADANNPVCADVIVRLPDTVADLERRDTNAQATGAWGSPASVLLYCGVEVPSASTQRCVQVEGFYWLVDGDQAPTYILRSYGREPAIDVVVDTEVTPATPALMDLARAVSYTVPNGHECTDLDDADIIAGDSGSGSGADG